MLFQQHPHYLYNRVSSADPARKNTGAVAAAEYGRLVVWARSPRYSGLGAALLQLDGASSALVLHLDSYSNLFSFLILAVAFSRVSCVCTPSSFSPKMAKSVFFRFCFSLLVFLVWRIQASCPLPLEVRILRLLHLLRYIRTAVGRLILGPRYPCF